MTQILEPLFSNLTLWSFKPVSCIWRGDLTEGVFLRYRFGGLIFGGAYFRNFTVYNKRSFLNRRNTTVPNRRLGENPGNKDSATRFKIWRMGLIWRIFSHDLESLLDLSRRLHCNASEDTLDFVSFRLQQILQHLVYFGGGLDGVPQSITDVRPFSLTVIVSLVEGSAICSLKARQTNALIHVFLRWKYGENAAGFLRPLPRCPRRLPITKNSPVLLPGKAHHLPWS